MNKRYIIAQAQKSDCFVRISERESYVLLVEHALYDIWFIYLAILLERFLRKIGIYI